jgi:hypothetical protein
MATARNLISTIRSSHKLLSTDSLLTDRGILAEIKIARNLLVKRELNLRKLWQTDSVFTTIPCLEMCEVSISECCNYVDPCSVARTTFKLPRISEGNYQYVIQGVYSINAMSGKGRKLKEITVNRYINLLKLPVIKKEEYFWISNGYLYVSNPLLKAIRFVALFEEDVTNEIMYPECGCGTPDYTNEQLCMNPLDKEFPLPGYLEQQVLELTSKKLLSTYFQIKTDITQEGIDGQAPNSKSTN